MDYFRSEYDWMVILEGVSNVKVIDRTMVIVWSDEE